MRTIFYFNEIQSADWFNINFDIYVLFGVDVFAVSCEIIEIRREREAKQSSEMAVCEYNDVYFGFIKKFGHYMYWLLARPSQQLHTNEGKIWIENNMYCWCAVATATAVQYCCGASSNLTAAIFFCSNDNSVSTNKHDTHIPSDTFYI